MDLSPGARTIPRKGWPGRAVRWGALEATEAPQDAMWEGADHGHAKDGF